MIDKSQLPPQIREKLEQKEKEFMELNTQTTGSSLSPNTFPLHQPNEFFEYYEEQAKLNEQAQINSAIVAEILHNTGQYSDIKYIGIRESASHPRDDEFLLEKDGIRAFMPRKNLFLLK